MYASVRGETFARETYAWTVTCIILAYARAGPTGMA